MPVPAPSTSRWRCSGACDDPSSPSSQRHDCPLLGCSPTGRASRRRVRQLWPQVCPTRSEVSLLPGGLALGEESRNGERVYLFGGLSGTQSRVRRPVCARRGGTG